MKNRTFLDNVYTYGKFCNLRLKGRSPLFENKYTNKSFFILEDHIFSLCVVSTMAFAAKKQKVHLLSEKGRLERAKGVCMCRTLEIPPLNISGEREMKLAHWLAYTLPEKIALFKKEE